MKKQTAKHKIVRQALAESIRRGDYKPGDRIPAERDLAEIYGVSYMTARRAVTEMVEVDLLCRRPREGTFVPPRGAQRLATQTVHLVCSGVGSSLVQQFVQLGDRKIEERGWRTEIIQRHHSQVRPVARALESDDLLLMLAADPQIEGPLAEALQNAGGRAIVLGNRLDERGVPSILADDSAGIRLAMEHLRDFGHREIAIVTAHPDHNIDRVQIAAWKAAAPASWDEAHFARRMITVKTPRHQNHSDHSYYAVRDYLAGDGGETTALICLLDTMILPALAACRDAGRAAPEKMSLIASGNNSLLDYAYPPVTCVDVHMEQHIDKALEVFDKVLSNDLQSSDLLHLIKPHLVFRQSVQNAPKSAR